MGTQMTNGAGLSEAEAAERLRQFGPNQTAKPRRISFLGIAKEEMTEPLILLLIAVGVLYSVWGSLEDALTIFSIIIVLVLVEILNEYRAKKAISALSRMAAPKTRVLRDGSITEVETERIVPGDVLILTSGTRIAADGRLFVSLSLQVDESSLTGESLPQPKDNDDEIIGGTLVVAGEGQAEVTATGRDSRFGKISALAQEIKEPMTPLQEAMESLAEKLVGVALVLSLVIPLLGYLRGQDLQTMLLTGLALAFATVPEEGPIIITMILGLGAYRLSQHNFLIKKIKAAEVLGDATVILTDKTGTITENRMSVVSVFPERQELSIIKIALATMTEMSLSPTDKAIKEKASELRVETQLSELLRERSFGNGRKTKSLLCNMDGGLKLYVSGAPEEVLDLVEEDHARVLDELEKQTAKGRRVISLAQRSVSYADRDSPLSSLEKNMDFVGLISLEDPPREGVKETIELARQAGIRTIMVTGDHPHTASFIAESVGIPSERVMSGSELEGLSEENLRDAVREVSVFARSRPEDKYRLVKALRADNEVVAVTGDGVNDTLALKAADIGIAMGLKGTDAAKEAADVVLADDDFVTIGRAIFEGRKFFDNLRKGWKYYLSAKMALVLIFILPLVMNIPFPLAPIQIIVLELFMDLAASAAFVSEPEEKAIYTRPPKSPKVRLLGSRTIARIIVSGVSLFAAVSLSYFYARWQNLSLAETQTYAFAAWIMGHVILAFVSRSEGEPLYKLGLLSNRVMDAWAIASFAFLFIGVFVPMVTVQLRLSSISIPQLGLVFVICFLVISWQELGKILMFKKRSRTVQEKTFQQSYGDHDEGRLRQSL